MWCVITGYYSSLRTFARGVALLYNGQGSKGPDGLTAIGYSRGQKQAVTIVDYLGYVATWSTLTLPSIAVIIALRVPLTYWVIQPSTITDRKI